jgi:hypothetical protein
MRPLFRILVIFALIVFILPAAAPARAATAAVGSYFAGCGNFSVDVAVTGFDDDGGNLDRFRYLVTDGNGKKLYQEDATRTKGVSASSQVFNLGYDQDGVFDGGPGKNPIKFAVLDLDGNNNVKGEIGGVTYDAGCLSPSGQANRFGTFQPQAFIEGTLGSDTNLYDGPAGNKLPFVGKAGAKHLVIYRTADNAWIAIFIGSNDLVWVPGGVIGAYLPAVNIKPVRVDGSTLHPPANPAPVVAGVPGAPTDVTGRVRTNLRIRQEPTTRSAVLFIVPINTTVKVLGRNANRTFVKIDFNGQIGWASSGFITLNNRVRLASLAVVQ